MAVNDSMRGAISTAELWEMSQRIKGIPKKKPLLLFYTYNGKLKYTFNKKTNEEND